MRQEPNNGIDLLLRQLGRREESLSPESDGQHLDADELSSYVANALPPAARTRYMQHLADCSSCRKIVVQLSAAEGAVAVTQPASVVAPSGLKSFLASLFSPMVLRYAVPALGLIVLTAVGIYMFRQEQPGRSVARIAETEGNRSLAETPSAATTPTPAAQPYVAEKSESSAKTSTDKKQPAPAEEAPRVVSEEAPPPPAKAAVAEEPARQKIEEKEKLEKAAGDIAVTESRRDYNAVKREQQRASDQVGTAAAPVVVAGNKPPEPSAGKSGSGAVLPLANAPSSREAPTRGRKDEVQGDTANEETRTVSGRTFRKRGDIWIDTAYGSYQSLTIVARGSEQYRALVADEPGINVIAEALKSEFIVVWKGRAYRVR